MLEVKNLVKIYKTKGGVETKALDNVSVNFPETGLVFLLGKSGSGKSTLLNMIGGLDRPDSGEIVVKGRSSKDFSQADFDSYRNTYIGFIFQEYNVLNEFNIEQNISLALQLQGKKNDKEAVNALLKEVDLEGFNKRKPNTLSGGQKQRIAIARALIKQPEIIMADEPTGALDSTTGKQVLETLKKLSKTKLVIIVSHDQDFAEEYGDRIIELKDGQIISDKSKEFVAPKAINEKMQIINGNIIDIKKGSDLTEADFKQLYQMIKKQDKEVLIATGEDNIKVTKKAARISNDGKGERFSDTKEVKLKEYDGKQTKFIRSHMPFSRSFKMGASGLKTKPIRLIFTILLSMVSFTMFGVVSTLMFYDPAYSLAKAMENMDRRSETVAKFYKYDSKSATIDNATGEVVESREYGTGLNGFTYFGAQEIKDLNNGNQKFIGVFDFGNNYLGNGNFITNQRAVEFINVEVSGDASDYYQLTYFTGVSDNAKEVFQAQGYQLTGEYPTSASEIAISNYHFDLLKESNAIGSLTDYNSALGKSLKVTFRDNYYRSNDVTLKITGVYNFGELSSRYNALKSPKPATQNQKDRTDEIGKFTSYVADSFYTTGYVAPAFMERYAFMPNNNRGGGAQTVWAQGLVEGSNRKDIEERTVSSDYSVTFYIAEDIKDAGFEYFDTDFKKVSTMDLKSKEVLLPYNNYYYDYLQQVYYAPLSNASSFLSAFSNLDPEIKELAEGWNNWGGGGKEGGEGEGESEVTNETLLAYYRIRDFFNNRWENPSYPEGYTMEGDYTAVNTKLKSLYEKFVPYKYVNAVFNRISNYYSMGHEDERPPYAGDDTDWNALSIINSKMYDENEQITDEEFNTLKNGVKTVLTRNPNLQLNDWVISSVMADFFINAQVVDYEDRSTFENAFKEATGDEIWSAINNVVDTQGTDVDYVNVLKTGFEAGYKAVFGEEATVSYVFDPLFVPYRGFAGKTSFEVPEKYYTKDVGGNIVEYTVKGFYNSSNEYGNYSNVYIRSDMAKYLKESYTWKDISTTDYVAPSDAKYSAAIAATSYSQSDIAKFSLDNGSYSYSMTNSIYSEVSTWTNMITTLKTVFLIVGAVTGALAALLLLNFISVSISSKNKDIGILRAVGARGSDVFKIFFSESGLITLICFVLAAVAGGVTCFYLNNAIKDSLGIALLNYGVINILLILGVSIVISFVATIIPVAIASKKPPVEAIRSL